MAEAAGTTRVELTVGGKVHGGWTDVSIEIGLDSLASSFQLGLAEQFPGQGGRFVLEAGAEAKVSIGGETVVTGFIDRLDSSIADTDHRITIAGRSKAADLLDASAVTKPGRWTNRSLEAIASDIAKPFGLSVVARAKTTPVFKAFALQPGETAFAAIERLARLRGLLPVSDTDGTIAIVTPEPKGAAIRIAQGKHIVELSASHDVSQRFSEYIVKGQTAGDDQASGKTVSGPSATATDPGVKRYRPLIVVAEDQADLATCKARAKWEATVRAAKGQEASLTLAGWRRPDGKLWAAQDKVLLEAPAGWIDGEVMVASVTFTLDEQGSRVVLRLVRPEAYSQEPVSPKAEASKVRK